MRQWSGDGQSLTGSRKVRRTFAIVVPILLAVGVVAVSAGSTSTGKQKLTAATSRFRHRPVPLPMPTAPPAAAGTDCGIVVPANPLTAQGLATPYQLTGAGCSMANVDTQAFVQATIIDPATGQLSVYQPLVITRGTTAAVAPVVPTLPAGAVVTIDFGFNGDNLTPVATTGGRRFALANSLTQGRCVSGLRGSIFGQVSYCNGPAFFRAAHAAIAAGTLKIPAAGTASDGQACPTTRSFAVIDQDQSDNVTSKYLLTASGQTAQDNAANTAALTGGSTPIDNGSDNALLNFFMDPALGCAPFTAPDLSNGGTSGTSQALDELQAAADQQAPVALVPVNDPMTEVNGNFSLAKTNLYRAGFDQPMLRRRTNLTQNATTYCTQMMTTQIASLERDQAALTAAPPADPAVGNNLFTFLAARLSGSFTNLGCGNLGVKNSINLTVDANGVATAATFNGTGTASPSPSPTASTTASPTAAAVSPTPSPSGSTPATAPPSTPPAMPAASAVPAPTQSATP